MAHPSSAQNIVPVSTFCTIFSANRSCALFTPLPPCQHRPRRIPVSQLCYLTLRVFVVLHVVGVLFRDLCWSPSNSDLSRGATLPAANALHYLIDSGHF